MLVGRQINLLGLVVRFLLGWVTSWFLGMFLVELFVVLLMIVVELPIEKVFFRTFFTVPFLPGFSSTGDLEITNVSQLLGYLFFWFSVLGLGLTLLINIFPILKFLINFKFQVVVIVVLHTIALIRIYSDDLAFLWIIPLMAVVSFVLLSFYTGVDKVRQLAVAELK